MPNLSEDEDDAADESDGWDEMETNGEQTTCLFCSSQFRTIAVALDHCRTEHNFDLLELKLKYNMDCYSFIKMINYIRQHKPEPSSLINSEIPVWNDDVYLKPIATETWLMYGTSVLILTLKKCDYYDNIFSQILRIWVVHHQRQITQ